MNTQTARSGQHLEKVDAYDRRFGRMSVLVDWLNDEVVQADAGKYDEMVTRAVYFLFEEMQACESEQAKIEEARDA